MTQAEKAKLRAENDQALKKFVEQGGKVEYLHTPPDPSTRKPLAMRGKKAMRGRNK